uniref:Uncharacterized protein n=1 Tax=Colletotrichum liriopes TaxID=708192 RepID=A0AA37GS71_9PEZI|nr:hypothetical protein ColLi_09106 [Colletotrichum liriopes]
MAQARTLSAEIDDEFPLDASLDTSVGTVLTAERALQTATEDVNKATDQLRLRIEQGEAAKEAETLERSAILLDPEIKEKVEELDSWLGNTVAAAERKALKAANAARQAMDEIAEARRREVRRRRSEGHPPGVQGGAAGAP